MFLVHHRLLDGCCGHFCHFAGNRRDFRQTEVENFGMAALGDEDVARLDVAVDDPFGMRGVQCVGNFDSQSEQDFGLDGPSGNAMLQGHAVQKFHGDESVAAFLPNVVNGADVGVVQRGSRLGFSPETA